jgi:pseudouridine synthase
MRLQVFLSHNGVCSRREAMVVVADGRVRVDGLIIREPSYDVKGEEDIQVDGKKVRLHKNTYIMLHKPAGYTTTKDDPYAEKTVLDLLPKEMHFLSPVGRLDRDSEGLLLFTNDGDLALRLTHPKFHLNKLYLVHVKGRLTQESVKHLKQGVLVDGKKTAPCLIKDLRYNDPNTEFEMIIYEGRKRQIRLMLRSVGHQVTFLKRMSIGPLTLGDLKLGAWRSLTETELEALRKT